MCDKMIYINHFRGDGILFRKKSILLGWALTYVILLVIPLCVGLLSMTKMEGDLRREIVRSNEAVLTQMQTECDRFLYSLNDMYSLLVLDEDIKALSKLEPYSSEGSALLKNIKAKMNNQKSAFGMIEEAYVYYPGKNLIISSHGIVDFKSAYSMWHNGGLKYEDWIDWLNAIEYKEYLITERKFTGEKERVITLVGSNAGGNTDLRIVVFLNMAQLEAKLTEYSEINGGRVILADEKKRIILNCGSNAVDAQKLLNNKSNGDYIVSSKNSSVKKWTFYTVMEENKYWGAGKSAQRLMWFSALFCLLLGGIFIAYTLFWNYRPIKNIISAINYNSQSNTNKNEYDFIESKINEIISERDNLSGQLEKSRNVLQNDVLHRLLNSRFYKQEEMEKRLQNARVFFESNLFAVALVNIEDYVNIFSEDVHMSNAERHELTVVIVSNIVKEMVEEHHQCFIAEQNERLAAVISVLHENREKALTEIKDALCKSINAVEEHFGIYISASISDIHEGIFGISECNSEASETMSISELIGEESVLSYNMLSEKYDTKTVGFSVENELSMIKFMNEGDWESAVSLLDEIFERIVKNKSVSAEDIHLLAADMGHTFIKADSDAGIIGLKNMINTAKIKDLYIAARECIISICEKTQEENKIYQSDLNEKIKRFIIENYSDQSLCAQSIASHFGLSGSYLSEKFKSETDESLHHLISKVRVEKAKELMQNPAVKLEKVAQKVGFCDQQALRRAFKRHEGVLPSDYRRK